MATKQKTQTVSAEWASRQAKSARFAASFYANGLHSSQIGLLEWSDPIWYRLALSISKETGRRLLPPHSQETVECIVACLRDFEGAKRAAEQRQGAVAFDATTLQEAK